MGAVMHFQRTLNRFSRENVPGYLAVFIGGFGDMFAGCLSRVEKGFPGFLPGVAYATAYYHWDGGGCGVFFDRCGKIAVELEELRRRYPGLPVVLIGHSYGGSCAVEVARRQSVQAAPLCLLTVDAVARRQKSVLPPATVGTGRAAFILTGVLRPCFMSRLGKKHAAFFKPLPPGWKEIFRTELPEPCYRFSSSHFTSWERSWLIRRSVCSLAFSSGTLILSPYVVEIWK